VSECKNCLKETSNPKYCSSSCAAQINNRLSKKRKLKRECSLCDKLIRSNRKYCESCFIVASSAVDMTLEEATYDKHHRSSAFALVRSRARSTEKAKTTKACEHCGWDRHVEVCHKKPISDYPLSTMISEINSEDNLLILCPNCHWLFDHKS
jgi:hypothetical protein